MKKLIWIAVLLALAAGGWFFLRKKETQDVSANAYREIRVGRGDIRFTIQSTATIRPENRVEIKPSISGRMEEVLVMEGDAVKRGQVLGLMSSTERAALLDAARARGEAELAKWQETYKPAAIVAPLDGTIILRDVEPGQTVTAADAILVISDHLIVEARADETDLSNVRVGLEALVTLDAYPDHVMTGVVSHISYEAKTVDNVTVYEVVIRVDRAPEFMRSGMTALVTFQAASALDVLVVPAEAVRAEDGVQTVLTPGSAGSPPVPREVETGLSDGRNTEIKAGLAEGDALLVPTVQGLAPSTLGSNPFMPTPPGMRARGSRSSGGGSQGAGRGSSARP